MSHGMSPCPRALYAGAGSQLSSPFHTTKRLQFFFFQKNTLQKITKPTQDYYQQAIDKM